MRVAFEEALSETQLLLNTSSHGAGDNVAVELELLLHGGPESGGNFLRASFGGCAICGIIDIVAVARHGCAGLESLWEGRGFFFEKLGGGGGCWFVEGCLVGWLVVWELRDGTWGSHSATLRVNDFAMSNMDHCPLPSLHLHCPVYISTAQLTSPLSTAQFTFTGLCLHGRLFSRGCPLAEFPSSRLTHSHVTIA